MRADLNPSMCPFPTSKLFPEHRQCCFQSEPVALSESAEQRRTLGCRYPAAFPLALFFFNLPDTFRACPCVYHRRTSLESFPFLSFENFFRAGQPFFLSRPRRIALQKERICTSTSHISLWGFFYPVALIPTKHPLPQVRKGSTRESR